MSNSELPSEAACIHCGRWTSYPNRVCIYCKLREATRLLQKAEADYADSLRAAFSSGFVFATIRSNPMVNPGQVGELALLFERYEYLKQGVRNASVALTDGTYTPAEVARYLNARIKEADALQMVSLNSQQQPIVKEE